MKSWLKAGALAALLGAAAPVAGAPRLEVYPEAPSPGEVFVVRVEDAAAAGPWVAQFGGHRFALWSERPGVWGGLVAVDRDAGAGMQTLEVRRAGAEDLGAVLEHALQVRPRDYPVQRLTVSEKLVTLSAEDQARAGREARKIRATLAGNSSERLWEAPFGIPVEGPVSSPFGVRRYYNGKRRGFHAGLDLAVPRGKPVAAPARGMVALVGDFFYTGNTVFLDHGLGLYTAYFHLDSVAVAEGDALPAGSVLGRVGSTGRSTGPHLHWGVYLAGLKVDPLSLVRALGGAAGGGEEP